MTPICQFQSLIFTPNAFKFFSLCSVADVASAKCLAQSQWSASLTLFKSFYISICNFFIFTKSILRPSVRLYAGPSDPFPNLEQQQQREKDFRLCGWQIRKINKKKLWIFPMIFLNVDGMCVRLSGCLCVRRGNEGICLIKIAKGICFTSLEKWKNFQLNL